MNLHLSVDNNIFPNIVHKEGICKTVSSYWYKLGKTILNKVRYNNVHIPSCDVVFIGKPSHFRWCYSKKQKKMILAEEYALPLQEILGDRMITIISDNSKTFNTIPKNNPYGYIPIEYFYNPSIFFDEISHYKNFDNINSKFLPEFVRYINYFINIVQSTSPYVVFVSGWLNILACSFVCHAFYPDTKAPRGSRNGTQGIKMAEERARVPYALSETVCKLCEREIT